MISFFDLFPEYNGQKIEVRGKDGYFSATDMGRILGKRLADWRRTNFARRLLNRLSEKSGMLVEQQLRSRGGESATPATGQNAKARQDYQTSAKLFQQYKLPQYQKMAVDKLRSVSP